MNNKCQSLFFIRLPELQKFCVVKVIVRSQLEATELRTAQRKMCRKLLLLDQDVLSSPVPGTLNQISVVMTIPFYNSGKLQAYVEKHGAMMAMPERVVPAVFQMCLSYTLITKLAPSWNQAGHLLIQGRDFLSQLGKQNAVVMDLNVSETHLCISVEVCTVRLPPPEMEDFYISANILKRFDSDENEIIQRHSILNNWCYVLPSMKMGQIINISHLIPLDSTFQSYRDIQLYWENLYGYILPEDLKIYCSIYFKPIGEQLFTYPLSCIRSQPVQYFPRVDLEGVLNAFLTDLKAIIPRTCGFPLKMTSKALYTTQELTQSSLQKINSIPPNLTRKRNCEVILSQEVSKKDLCPSTCVIGKSHKMELKVNKPKMVIVSDLGSLAKNENTGAVEKQAHRQKQLKTLEESVLMLHSNESLKMSENSTVDSLKKDSTGIIPIFKGKLLQLDRQITKVTHGKNMQSVSRNSAKVTKMATAAKLDIFKPSTDQVNKSSHDAPLENITGTVPQTQPGKTNVKSSKRALKEKNGHGGSLANSSFANEAILDRNSSKIKPRRLNSSLLATGDTSVHHESTIQQHLEKPANFNSRGRNCGFFAATEATPVPGPSKQHKIKMTNHDVQLNCQQVHQYHSRTTNPSIRKIPRAIRNPFKSINFQF
ncbi:uncharacterized protein C18orf63 homolog [Tiliqua scincoides]|uniref:uncharacterized protein C18orf63 homolog n=1 Tax=Tiliqua scincoides TaxID=71010 RepID=UPI003461E62D